MSINKVFLLIILFLVCIGAISGITAYYDYIDSETAKTELTSYSNLCDSYFKGYVSLTDGFNNTIPNQNVYMVVKYDGKVIKNISLKYDEIDGVYNYKFNPKKEGEYDFEAYFDGNDKYNSASVSWNDEHYEESSESSDYSSDSDSSSSSSSYETPSDIFVEGVLRDYDFDGDGYISASEWNDWCMAEGYAPMSDCDLDGDGYCSKSELRTYSHEFGY